MPGTGPTGRQDLFYQEVSEGGVLFDAEGERVYVLNGSAAFIWNCLDGRSSTDDIVRTLAEALGRDRNREFVDGEILQDREPRLVRPRGRVAGPHLRPRDRVAGDHDQRIARDCGVCMHPERVSVPLSIVDDQSLARALAAGDREAFRLLVERDGGLTGERGEATRLLLYLFERDWGVQLLRGG